MRRIALDMDLATEDTDGLANDLTGAGPWTPNIATEAPDKLAHIVSLTSTANLSAITITLTGTDADGNVITDSRAGPNNNTVQSAKYFRTLTAISASSTLAGNTMDVGFADEAVSQTIDLNPDFASYHDLNVTGTISVDTDWSVRPRTAPAPLEQASLPWLDGSGVASTLDAETASSAAAVAVGPGYAAMRYRINSYSAGAEIQVYINNKEK